MIGGAKEHDHRAIALAVGLVFCVGLRLSAENSDPGPEQMPAEAFSGLSSNSPFVRNLDVSGNLILSGYWEIGDESFVTVIDGRSKQSLVLSTTPDDRGRRVLELAVGAAMEEVTAKVSIDGRVMSLRYDSKVVASFRPKASPAPEVATSSPRKGRDAQSAISKSFSKLNSDQKQAMRKEILASREKLATMSSEQRSAFIREVIERAATK